MAARDVQIRLAVVDEAETIAKIIRDSFAEFEGKYTREAFAVVRPPADEIRGRFEEGPIWVALRNSEVIATVSAVPEPEWLYIRSMAVLPAAQGLGVGRKLLNVVETYAVENGFDRLFLYTTRFSSNAIKLYEKNGFQRGRNTSAEEWFGTPGLSMDKKIRRNIKQNAIGS